MAETATMIATRPPHLQALHAQALAQAHQMTGRPMATDPDDAYLVRQCYDALRYRACQAEIENAGIVRMLGRLYGMAVRHGAAELRAQ